VVQERREMDLAQAAKGRDGDGLSLATLLMAKAERGLAARTALFDFTSAGSDMAAQFSTVITSMVKLAQQSRVPLIVQHVK